MVEVERTSENEGQQYFQAWFVSGVAGTRQEVAMLVVKREGEGAGSREGGRPWGRRREHSPPDHGG